MIRPPRSVIIALGATTLTGVFFGISSASGGALPMAMLFLVLPVWCSGVWRGIRGARRGLVIFSLLALAPLAVGIALTWPEPRATAPYLLGIAALLGGIAGILTPQARRWHAAMTARRAIAASR